MPTSPTIANPTPVRSTLACAICGSQHLTPSSLRSRCFNDSVPGFVEIDESGVFQDPDADALDQTPLIEFELVCEHGHVTWFSWRTKSKATVVKQGVFDGQTSRATLPARPPLSPEEKLLRAIFQKESEQDDEDDLPDGGLQVALDRSVIHILRAQPEDSLWLRCISSQIDDVMAVLFTHERCARDALRLWLSMPPEQATARIETTCEDLVRRGLARRGDAPGTFGMDASQAARARTPVALQP